MPNPKWEVYENKATGIEYDLTDADAQSQLTAIKDGTNIDSFGDVETALSTKYDINDESQISILDYDYVPYYADAESATRKIYWTNIKNGLKSFFDDLYCAIGLVPSGASTSNKLATASDVNAKVSWADAGKSVKRNEIVFSAISGSKNNVTWTVNEDKSIRVVTGSGGASANTTITLMSNVTDKIGNGETRVISGCPLGGSWQSYCIYIDQTGASADTGNGAIITLNGTGTQFMSIFVANGANIDKTFYPMLTKVGIPTTPYAEPIPDNTELFPRSEQLVLAAKNLGDVSKTVPLSTASVVFANNGFTVSGTSMQYISSKMPMPNLEVGKRYIASVDVTASNNAQARIAIRDGSTQAIKFYKDFGTTLGHYELEFEYQSGYYFSAMANQATSGDASLTVDNVMIRVASDPDSTYAPRAMTNKELTDLGLVYRGVIPAGASLDDYVECGMWDINGTNPTSLPTGSSGYVPFIVLPRWGRGNIKQIIISRGNEIYLRNQNDGESWGSWYKFTGTIVS